MEFLDNTKTPASGNKLPAERVESNRGRKAPSYGIYLAAIVAGIIGALCIVEMALRLPGVFPNGYFETADEYVGWRGSPNARGVDKESGNQLLLSSQGLHDREHSKTKPPNTLRIAVLGDSMTEARQVPIEKTFCALLEHNLSACPSIGKQKMEVINFGVWAYGTAQELLTLRHYVWDYRPDVVVLAVFTGNDVADNFYHLFGPPWRPYFVHRGGKLMLDQSHTIRPWFLARCVYWIRLHSRVFQLLVLSRHSSSAYWYRLMSHRRGGALTNGIYDSGAATQTARAISMLESQGYPSQVYSEPKDPVWQEAWRVTKDLIVAINAEVTAKGANFLLVTLSDPAQVYPDPSVRQQFMRRNGVQDLFYPESRFRALAQREGIPILTLSPTFQQYADEHKVFLHGFGSLGGGHWNEGGQRLAGILIGQKLCGDILARDHSDAASLRCNISR